MTNARKNLLYSLVLASLIGIVWLWRTFQSPKMITLQGNTMGSTYQIKYIDVQNRNFQSDIDSILAAFTRSLSTWEPESEISRFNKGDSLVYESPFFYPVLQKSLEVYIKTDGAFNPAVKPLVNAWGFGENKKDSVNQHIIDSLLTFSDFRLVRFDEKKIVKLDKRVMLDFNAIAPGYACDVIGEFLRKQGIERFMIEISGEILCKGLNLENQPWKIGIEDPRVTEDKRKVFRTVALQEQALATSGNYRNFYIKNGKKYAHTINPKTGMPAQHNLLSASVIAPDCMSADAYATACMVLGLHNAKQLLEQNPDLEGMLIYDEEGTLKVYTTQGFERLLLP
ncbi:MAG: FAD:protein FMN transferase [Cytophagales bacterium]|nr:FAD:protein FMN transferase [Cytophagales bacterium]MDW8383822.1 FAD:protein FMN transferase [Flammeovirgaceae bacterium]